MLDAERARLMLPAMGESVYAPEYRVFLEHLKAARDASSLTQRELAVRLGKSYSYVAKVETGYTRMDVVQIRAYLDAVGLPFAEFMRRYDEAVQKLKQR